MSARHEGSPIPHPINKQEAVDMPLTLEERYSNAFNALYDLKSEEGKPIDKISKGLMTMTLTRESSDDGKHKRLTVDYGMDITFGNGKKYPPFSRYVLINEGIILDAYEVTQDSEPNGRLLQYRHLLRTEEQRKRDNVEQTEYLGAIAHNLLQQQK